MVYRRAVMGNEVNPNGRGGAGGDLTPVPSPKGRGESMLREALHNSES